MSVVAPSASYSLTVRVAIQNRAGMLGKVASAIGDAGGDIGAVDLVESQREQILRDITIDARTASMAPRSSTVSSASRACASSTSRTGRS